DDRRIEAMSQTRLDSHTAPPTRREVGGIEAGNDRLGTLLARERQLRLTGCSHRASFRECDDAAKVFQSYSPSQCCLFHSNEGIQSPKNTKTSAGRDQENLPEFTLSEAC